MADDIEEWLGNTTQHVSARDVGSYVAEKFESTRKRISAAIEEQLARIRSLPDTVPDTTPLSRLPNTDVPPETSDQPPAPLSIPHQLLPMFPQSDGSIREASRVSAPYPSAMPWNAQNAQAQAPAQGEAPQPPPPQPGTAPIPMPGPTTRMLGGTHDSAGVTSSAPFAAAVKSSRSAKAASVVLALLLVAGAGSAVFLRLRAKHPEPAPAPTSQAVVATAQTPEATTGSAVGTVADAAQIEVTIKASPPEARIFVDGNPMPANPATTNRPRDGAIHLLRIEAPGYEPREQTLPFDRSVLVDIELHPSAAASDPSMIRAGKRTRTPRPRGSAGAKGIDSENPY
jgi:hypothetical protein